MKEGDRVRLLSDKSVVGVIARLPRSEGRNRPRCLVHTETGSMWVHVDELEKVESEP